jgi:serine protease
MHPSLATRADQPTRPSQFGVGSPCAHVALWAGLVLILAPAHAWCATLHVPSEHATIQAAIDAASSGDSILVAPGTYVEHLDTRAKMLVLRSELGPASTVIDGGGQGRVIDIAGGGTLEGFTIRNGYDYYAGGGIRVRGSVHTAILNNVIESNAVGEFDLGSGGGIACYPETRIEVRGNIIRNNSAGDSGAGIWDQSAIAGSVIANNTIEGGWCHVCGGGIAAGPSAVIENNLIRLNIADSFGAGICVLGGVPAIENNTVVGNINGNPTFVHGAGIHVVDGSPVVRKNIIARNRGITGLGAGVRCAGTSILECNDSWGNDSDDYLLVGGCDTTGGRNIAEDPKFCGPDQGDYRISSESPCAGEAATGCGLIGAFPVGCGATRVETSTWGRLKARYR